MQEDFQIYSESENLQRPQRQIKLLDKSFENHKDKKQNLRQTEIVSEAENENQIKQDPESQKRVSNFVVPNMIREIKKVIRDAFRYQYRHAYNLLEKMITKFKIKYQVWGLDAILVCLLFLRDRTPFLNPAKYYVTIENIRSLIYKTKEKAEINSRLRKEQLELINTQCDIFIQYLLQYENPKRKFQMLNKQEEKARGEFFKNMLTIRKKLKGLYLGMIHKIEEFLLNENAVEELEVLQEKKVEKLCQD